MARMSESRKSESLQPATWTICKFAVKHVWLGEVEATTNAPS
jgi:hypothetical protein